MFFLVNSVGLANNFDDSFLFNEEQKLERQRQNDNRSSEQEKKFPKFNLPRNFLLDEDIIKDEQITKNDISENS